MLMASVGAVLLMLVRAAAGPPDGAAQDDPVIVEAFTMDDRGALVCATVETSDYWQGDEAKWQKTFLGGQDAWVEPPALDASTGTYAVS